MRVVFQKIQLENFMCFKDVPFGFGEQGFHLVVGEVEGDMRDSNGAGKSALFEALIFALFGKTMREVQVAKVVMSGEDEAQVKLWFKIGDTKYKVVRKRTMVGRGSTVWFYRVNAIGSIMQDLTGSRVDETDEKIRQVLGFSFELFKNSVFYGQGLPYRFVQATDASKKAIMDEILSLAWTATTLERTKDVDKVYQQILDKATLEVNSARQTIELLDSSISSYEDRKLEAQQSLEDERRRVAEGTYAQVSPDAIMAKVEECNAEVERLTESSRVSLANIRTREGLLEAAHALENESKTGLALVEARVAEIHRLQREKNEQKGNLESTDYIPVCPLCKQTLDARHRVEVSNKLEEEIGDLGTELLIRFEEKERLSTRIPGLRADVEGCIADMSAEREQYQGLLRRESSVRLEKGVWEVKFQGTSAVVRERLQRFEADVSRWDDAIVDDGERRGRLHEKIERFEAVRRFAQDILAGLRYWELGFSNRGIKALVLEMVLPYLNGRAEYYSDILTDGEFRVQFLVSGEPYERFTVEVDSRVSKVDYTQFSGGERRRVDVIVLMALHDLISGRNQVEVNIQIFDEVCENLDGVGIELLMEFLKEKSREKSVYVISHNEDFASHFTSFIKVHKNLEGVSTVQTGGTLSI